jgi:Zn-dependent M16 (insulinase) family peptidase
MDLQMYFVGAGHQFARTRASAMVTGAGAAQEALSGSTVIQWVKARCADDDAALQTLAAQLKALATKAFTAGRMTVGISDNAEGLEASVIAAFPVGEAAGAANFAPMAVTQVGLPIPAPIGFAAKASNIKNHGGSFTGSTHVLANILRFSYLWNEIRVQGGAYGCGFSGMPNGDMFFHTYRDPQPGRSLDVFDKAAEFIRNYCAETEDLTPMILGAFSAADPLLNTQRQITVAEGRYFTGTTYEDTCRISRELVETTKEDLLALTEALEQIAKDNAVCVVAGQPLLDACGEKLAQIQQVL